MILYEAGVAIKELVFDATGTDKLNWFSVGKLTSSPWTDLTSQPRNYFTIQGDYHADGSGYRSFFISRSYGGCPSDDGWMATTQNTGWCSWDSTYKNKVVYSSLSTYTNWNSNGEARWCSIFRLASPRLAPWRFRASLFFRSSLDGLQEKIGTARSLDVLILFWLVQPLFYWINGLKGHCHAWNVIFYKSGL